MPMLAPGIQILVYGFSKGLTLQPELGFIAVPVTGPGFFPELGADRRIGVNMVNRCGAPAA
ncbi:hypothetical protein EAH89_29770 [Roseomonas nepalensis]|uniref:Uncharacterized protein n=1 Tax=Muricoccus nepalensis TaxID=1854500 RepID=A0A502EJQ7_9PROT|nr:hypothetical protein EAH89_29770 [Roseomonas nepalensis]